MITWKTVFVVGAMVVLATAGCGTAPTKLPQADSGLTIYVDRNYQHGYLTLDQDQPNLEKIEGPCSKTSDNYGSTPPYTWDDCVSSVQLSPGWTATLYVDKNYQGGSLTVTEDIPNLKNVQGKCGDDMDDCVSSIRVRRP